MKIMIHACPQRMWYVDEFLIPQLRDQGVRDGEFTVWNDEDGRGNLVSCVQSFQWISQHGCGHTWHIQDDVLLASDFAERARTLETETDGIVCGFCCANWGPRPIKDGPVPVPFMWNGFQCLRIPDRMAGEFADWFNDTGHRRADLQRWVKANKGDDSIFRAFCLERHAGDTVVNVAPNLADHVDFLIGGTVINTARTEQYNRARYWDEDAAVVELRNRLTERAAQEAAAPEPKKKAPTRRKKS